MLIQKKEKMNGDMTVMHSYSDSGKYIRIKGSDILFSESYNSLWNIPVFEETDQTIDDTDQENSEE